MTFPERMYRTIGLLAGAGLLAIASGCGDEPSAAPTTTTTGSATTVSPPTTAPTAEPLTPGPPVVLGAGTLLGVLPDGTRWVTVPDPAGSLGCEGAPAPRLVALDPTAPSPRRNRCRG